MNGAAIEQRDVGGDTKSEQRCLQHVCSSTGDLQDVGLLCARGAAKRPVEQPCMQPDPAEALIGEGDGIERSVNLRRRAAVVVEPLVFNKSFHRHNGHTQNGRSHNEADFLLLCLPSDVLTRLFLTGKPRQPTLLWIHRWTIRSSENKRVTIL
jgi:hypothetical protein